MSEKNPPAFPCDSREAQDFAGMSLRDYFAAAALGGMMADPKAPRAVDPSLYAQQAYMMADAMLRARKEPQT